MMVVFGGAGLDQDNTSVNLQDVHCLDTTTLTWSQPALSGSSPQERRYHTASVVDTKIYIFGGQYYDPSADLHFECDNLLVELDFDTLEWSRVEIPAVLPLRRACHSAGAVGRRIFVVGGRYWDVSEDDYIFLNDIQILDTAPCSSLATDWRNFLTSEQLSDVTLVVGGERFPAHRIVLAARCEYFRSMFLGGMREADAPEIVIPDVEVEVFRKVLDHLYTDSGDVPPSLALKLFTAAAFFQIERLKELCAACLENDMKVSTVCQILTVADQHNATYLKDESVSFIVAHFSEVHPTETFKQLHRHLLDLVHSAISARLFPTVAASYRPTSSSK